MAARGILSNPAMYAGYDSTPLQCVADWVLYVFSDCVNIAKIQQTVFQHLV